VWRWEAKHSSCGAAGALASPTIYIAIPAKNRTEFWDTGADFWKYWHRNSQQRLNA